MAKLLREVITMETRGDRYGEVTDCLCMNESGEKREIRLFNEVPDGFQKGIVLSDIEAVDVALMRCLEDKDIQTFSSILQRDVIYSVQAARESVGKAVGIADWLKTTYATCEVQQTVEALFFERNDLFAALIRKLLSDNNESFINAFLESLKTTDLNSEDLYRWDAVKRREIQEELNGLGGYARHIHPQRKDSLSKDKVKKIQETVRESFQIMNQSFPKREREEAPHLAHLRILLLKTELYAKLHQHDDILQIHRGYKRVAVNAFTLLFTAGIANLVHYKMTGQWLFFDKTNSQAHIARAEQSLGLGRRQLI